MKNKHIVYSGATVLALSTALISGTNNFLTKFAVTSVRDPLVFTTLKNAVVGILLVGVIIAWKKRKEIASLTRSQWLKLISIGVIGGSIPFALFFEGLSRTSAINAALIHKTLFLWVFLLGIPILKERITKWQWVGVATIFSAVILSSKSIIMSPGSGELLVLGATVLWAVENIIAKITLKDVSASVVAGARMIFGSLILGGAVIVTRDVSAVALMTPAQWGWTLLTGVLLGGYVLTWYSALSKAPATYVATLLVPALLVTNILNALFVTHALSFVQFASIALFVGGASLFVGFARRIVPTHATAHDVHIGN